MAWFGSSAASGFVPDMGSCFVPESGPYFLWPYMVAESSLGAANGDFNPTFEWLRELRRNGSRRLRQLINDALNGVITNTALGWLAERNG